MKEAWDPELYERFREQRDRPGRELLGELEPSPGCRAADLGCGTGELTEALHRRLQARQTLGLDSSMNMLARARARQRSEGLRFLQEDLREVARHAPFDVLFSNAALQWVEGHDSLFALLRDALSPGGRLAVQVPANHRHLSHHLAAGLAREEPWSELFRGQAREAPVLTPEGYAELLHDLGFQEPRVELRVYLHLLPGPESVLEWVSGTLLTWYQERLGEDDWMRFHATYGERLLERLPDRRPFPFTFPRLLIWARR